MNVHFWDFVNGPVKITLKPNQKLTYSKRYFNGEGYGLKVYDWELKDNKVIHQIYRDEIDCDGRLTTSAKFECNVNELKSVHNSHTNLDCPNWKSAGYNQRDFSAEAAGY